MVLSFGASIQKVGCMCQALEIPLFDSCSVTFSSPILSPFRLKQRIPCAKLMAYVFTCNLLIDWQPYVISFRYVFTSRLHKILSQRLAATCENVYGLYTTLEKLWVLYIRKRYGQSKSVFSVLKSLYFDLFIQSTNYFVTCQEFLIN